MPPTEYQVVSGDTLTGLAGRFYGDGSLFPVISVINHLADPNQIDVGQQLLIPYVTFRHQVRIEDGKEALAQQFYGDHSLYEIIPIANHIGQRDFVVGEWLLIPDLSQRGRSPSGFGRDVGGARGALVRRVQPVADHRDRQPLGEPGRPSRSGR